MELKKQLELEYPLPFPCLNMGVMVSQTDLDSFIEMCISDLQSDLEIYVTVKYQPSYNSGT